MRPNTRRAVALLGLLASGGALWLLARSQPLLWDRSCAAAPSTPPLAARDLVCYGTADGRIVAHSAADGSRRWECKTGASWVAGTLAADDRLLFAVGGQSVLHGIGVKEGREAWKRESTAVLYEPCRTGDALLVGEQDDLLALEPGSGSERWRWKAGPGRFPLRFAATEGAIFVAFGGRPGAARLDDAGKQVWRVEGESPAAYPPAVGGEVLLLTDATGRVLCLEAASGKERWRDSGALVPPVVADGLVVFAAGGSPPRLRALSAADGSIRWERALAGTGGEGRGPNLTPPLAGQGRVWMGESAHLIAWEMATGTEIGIIETPGRILFRPAEDRGRIYVLLEGRRLAAFDSP